MLASPFRSDCTRCAALCCLLLAFDRSELFALDKPALVPCMHLRRHACRIHQGLSEQGFAGCAAYDCYGAGPRVVHELFGGRSWRDDASLVSPMARAFSAMRSLQELRLLLETARQLPLDSQQSARLDELSSLLVPREGWPLASLQDFERSSLAREVADFLRSLRGRVTPAARRRLPLFSSEHPAVRGET